MVMILVKSSAGYSLVLRMQMNNMVEHLWPGSMIDMEYDLDVNCWSVPAS